MNRQADRNGAVNNGAHLPFPFAVGLAHAYVYGEKFLYARARYRYARTGAVRGVDQGSLRNLDVGQIGHTPIVGNVADVRTNRT